MISKHTLKPMTDGENWSQVHIVGSVDKIGDVNLYSYGTGTKNTS